MFFNFDNFTPEQLHQARKYAAQINRDCAAQAFSPDFGFASHVTDEDKQRYVDEQLAYAEEIERGESDHNFTVGQRMWFFLTGEMVALLP